MILLALALRVKVFIWSFISRGKFSIMLRISLRTVEEGPEDEDGSVIEYTHRGGLIIVVLRPGGFLENVLLNSPYDGSLPQNGILFI